MLKVSTYETLLCFLLLIFTNSHYVTAKAQYKEQSMTPIKRELAPQKRRYPVLEQLEAWLYPQKNFQDENPGHRLERLEIAILGHTVTGLNYSISERVQKLQEEVQSWQIAKQPQINIHKPKPSPPQIQQPQANFYHYQSYRQPYFQNNYSKARSYNNYDYDRANYQTARSLIHNVGRRAIDTIFRNRR